MWHKFDLKNVSLRLQYTWRHEVLGCHIRFLELDPVLIQILRKDFKVLTITHKASHLSVECSENQFWVKGGQRCSGSGGDSIQIGLNCNILHLLLTYISKPWISYLWLSYSHQSMVKNLLTAMTQCLRLRWSSDKWLNDDLMTYIVGKKKCRIQFQPEPSIDCIKLVRKFPPMKNFLVFCLRDLLGR